MVNKTYRALLLRCALVLFALALLLCPPEALADGNVDVKITFGVNTTARLAWGMVNKAGDPQNYLKETDYRLEVHKCNPTGELTEAIAFTQGGAGHLDATNLANGTKLSSQSAEFSGAPGLYYFKFFYKTVDMGDYAQAGDGGYFEVASGEDSQEFFLTEFRVRANSQFIEGTTEARGYEISVTDSREVEINESAVVTYVDATKPEYGTTQERYLVAVTVADAGKSKFKVTLISIANGKVASDWAVWSAENMSAANLCEGTKCYLELNFTAGFTYKKVTFKVSAGAPFRLFTYKPRHYVPFVEFPSSSLIKGMDGEYDTYTTSDGLPLGFFYETGGKGSGWLKFFQSVQMNKTGVQENLTITVNAEPFPVDPNGSGRIDYYRKGHPEGNFRFDNPNVIYDDVYLNLNNELYLEMKPGDKFNLFPIRVGQAQEGLVGNFFWEPDYHMDALGDGNAVSVPIGGDGRPRMSGAPGQEYYELTGSQKGVAALRLTYDPMAVYTQPVDRNGALGWVRPLLLQTDYTVTPDDNVLRFNITQPRLTGIAVVNVTDVDSSTLKTGIDRREYDTIYFARDYFVNGARDGRGSVDHAIYTFKPSVEGEPSADITARVHRPIHEGGGYERFDVEGDDPGWENGIKNADGSFTVKLYEGRNIVEVRSGGMVKYHVVTALALEVYVENKTRPGQPFQIGDTASISSMGMRLGPHKLAGIYNPSYPTGGYVHYTDAADGTRYSSQGVQYEIAYRVANEVEVPIRARTTRLTGVNYCSVVGKPLGTHRMEVPNDVGFGVNLDGVPLDEVADGTSFEFGIMPEIVIELGTTITIADIPGVTQPSHGATPVTNITTDEYAGAVTWSPEPAGGKFAADTAYTATITITPNGNYTLDGVTENFFKVAGAATTNAANSGVVTAVFPVNGGKPGAGGVSKDALNAAIASAESYDASKYTAESWSALQTALAAAKAVKADESATQAEIDGAARALNAAIDGLELRGGASARPLPELKGDAFDKSQLPGGGSDVHMVAPDRGGEIISGNAGESVNDVISRVTADEGKALAGINRPFEEIFGIDAETGAVVLNSDALINAMTESERQNYNTSAPEMLRLPMVYSGEMEDGKSIALFSLVMNLDKFAGYRASDLALLKLTNDGATVAVLSHAESSKELNAHRFMVTDGNGNPAGKIEPGVKYVVSAAIEDGSELDWCPDEGEVIDPLVMTTLAGAVRDDGGNGGSSVKDGGCDAGAGLGALGAIIAAFAARRRRRGR